MRWFETQGPVYPGDNYVVARTSELSDFVNRLKIAYSGNIFNTDMSFRSSSR